MATTGGVKCEYGCGEARHDHPGQCQNVREIDYRPDGSVARVEKQPAGFSREDVEHLVQMGINAFERGLKRPLAGGGSAWCPRCGKATAIIVDPANPQQTLCTSCRMVL